jgi:hypothetical protein
MKLYFWLKVKLSVLDCCPQVPDYQDFQIIERWIKGICCIYFGSTVHAVKIV